MQAPCEQTARGDSQDQVETTMQ
ncbi:protein of unknown function [Paraburkholderia kururiensis]